MQALRVCRNDLVPSNISWQRVSPLLTRALARREMPHVLRHPLRALVVVQRLVLDAKPHVSPPRKVAGDQV